MVTPRRGELADFLRVRRAALSPHDVALPDGGRRRTPGLRREEVAVLAGVSVTWYTFLEQGRPIRMSADALERVAGALRLSEQEARHLFLLADRAPLPSPSDTDVPEAIAALVEGLAESAAWLVDPLYNAHAWNRAAAVVWFDLAPLRPEDRNLIWLMHTEPAAQARHVDWQADTARLLAALRARAAENKADIRFTELVDRLKQASPAFREGWARHDVSYPASRTMNMTHPDLGGLQFLSTAVLPEAAPGMRLLVWTPDDSGPTRQLVRQLLAPSEP